MTVYNKIGIVQKTDGVILQKNVKETPFSLANVISLSLYGTLVFPFLPDKEVIIYGTAGHQTGFYQN